MARSLVVGIMSCRKNAAKRKAVEETWLRDLRDRGVDAFFLVGREGRPAEIDGDILYLDCGDTYATLGQKTLAFIRFVASSGRYDHLFKCDDDTYVDADTLLSTPYGESDYTTGRLWPYEPIGYRNWLRIKGQEWDPKYEQLLARLPGFPSGGEGYFLSRPAVDRILGWVATNSTDVCPGPSEDVLVAGILRSEGIAPRVIPEFTAEASAIYRWWAIPKRLPYATLHPVKPWLMRLIHARGGLIGRSGYAALKVVREVRRMVLGAGRRRR